MQDLQTIYPSNHEQFTFMKGLVRIARADCDYAEEEQIFFQNAATAIGLEPEQIAQLNFALQNPDVETDLSVSFNHKSQSLFLIKEAIQLCYIDGHYTEAEQLELQKIASELNVTPDAVTALEDWVDEGIRWTQQGQQLLATLAE